jgi:hypothetical protein
MSNSILLARQAVMAARQALAEAEAALAEARNEVDEEDDMWADPEHDAMVESDLADIAYADSGRGWEDNRQDMYEMWRNEY